MFNLGAVMPGNRSNVRHVLVAIVAGLITFAGVVGYWHFADRPDVTRREVVDLMRGLRPKMSRSDVGHLITSKSYRNLELRHVTDTRWLVDSPHSFGAQNWVVWLEFSGDMLTSARVRTADSSRIKPGGTPPDMEFPVP